MIDEHLSDCLKNRYQAFLLERDIADNLEQLTWLYNRKRIGSSYSPNSIVADLILEIDATGREDAGFEDMRQGI